MITDDVPSLRPPSVNTHSVRAAEVMHCRSCIVWKRSDVRMKDTDSIIPNELSDEVMLSDLQQMLDEELAKPENERDLDAVRDITAAIVELSDVKISGDLEIQEHTGKVVLENVKCRNFTSDGDTGSLVMTNVMASGEFNLERNTGDIEFHGCDAETIYVETDTGDVTGTLLTDKVFITETDTGSVDVPKSVTGGRCEISTDTGDIRIEIQ